MLRVEIEIPRPIETLSILLIVGGVALWVGWSHGDVSSSARAEVVSAQQDASGEGGIDRAGRVLALRSAEDDARRIRIQQAVLARQEEILRYQLKLLELQTEQGDGSAVQTAREELLRLLGDKRAAEQRFLITLKEMWEAEGLSAAAAIGTPGDLTVLWPVEPDLGLSATFLDAGYQRRFGIPHHAIDIPVEQGSAVRSVADGVVEKLMDNGLGYSYILIKHDNFATLYGHTSEYFVQEGDVVRQGDVIARSGGMPGTQGAGALTTGPHLHFEVIVEGERVDPLTILPVRSEVLSQEQ